MTEIETTDENLPKGSDETPVETGPKPIDPDLLEKLHVCKSIVSIDTLLTNCLFPGGAAGDIQGAKQFLQSLHSPIMKECQSHPDFTRATAPPSAAQPISEADIEAKKKAEAKRSRKATRSKRAN